MTPLEAALAIQHSTEVVRDPTTGLYVVDGTVPPTEMTLATYEAGMRVLDLRKKAAVGDLR